MEYAVNRMVVVNKDNLLAFVDVLMGGTWVVKGFKLLKSTKDGGKEELWISKPSTKRGEDWKDTVYPIVQGEMQALTDIVVGHYNSVIGAKSE